MKFYIELRHSAFKWVHIASHLDENDICTLLITHNNHFKSYKVTDNSDKLLYNVRIK